MGLSSLTTTTLTTITITITIITISPGPNAYTYAHNRWEAGCRFHWKIGDGDLLSPRFNCLPFLQNLRLQLSTPWQRDIVRSCRGGRAKDKVQTMISTDVWFWPLYPACHTPPATPHRPHPARRLAPSTPRVSLHRAHRSVLGSV